LVYFEKDDTFNVGVGKEKSRKYILISSSSTLTTEDLTCRCARRKVQGISKRKRGHEYSISTTIVFIVTNKDEAINFKLMKTPEIATTMENWEEVIMHREDVLEDIDIFKDYLVVSERTNGLNRIRIMP
jgi:oligopeptidase B